MELRRTRIDEVQAIIRIIKQAQDYFKSQGIDQWQNKYPNTEVIMRDVEKGNSYVILDESRIVGTAAIIFDTDPTYDYIEEGGWIGTHPYAVIHRIAVDDTYKGRGVATEIINHTAILCKSKQIYSIRIDTHADNRVMQNLLKKNQFEYCGVIYLQDGNKRLAFEKVLI